MAFGFSTPANDAVGNNDRRVSQYLKTWITGADSDSGMGLAVCGVTGPGTSKEVTANWQSPFEGESLGNKFQQAGGLMQAATDITLITQLNTRQAWVGNQPTKFNLELHFYALENVQKEVMLPLFYLEKMIAPQAAEVAGPGRLPDFVQLNIGRKMIYPNCVIENMSQPYDKEVWKGGGWIRCTVSLQISTIAMLNKTDIPNYGGG